MAKDETRFRVFKLDGEEYGTICRKGSPEGPLIIDLNMDTLKPSEARKLAYWLLDAANHVEYCNRRKL